MKVLVAEDDDVSRLVLEATLKKLGHEVVTALDGEEAWCAFQKEYFPIVITDWLMPRVNGPSLCARIRDSGHDRYTYIIMVTVLGGKDSFREAMDSGTDDFLTKPIDFEQLVARLRVAGRILQLQAEVRTLTGLFPICCYCKKIRNDQNYWERVEDYVSHQTGAVFSTGVCPDCYETNARGAWGQ